MSSILYIVLVILNIFGDILALVELPQVKKNNILETDTAIRETTNKLFSILKLKVSEQPTLKQYSVIHNYLVSDSLHDYNINLREIAKLTRVDKTRLNNQTKKIIAILNEILDDNIETEVETEDEYVIKHIEGFLENLVKYTDNYNYSDNKIDTLITEILQILEKNDSLTEIYHDNTLNYETNRLESSEENDTLIDENEFWEPNARRIYKGKKTNIKDFPFMASIQIFNHFQCAGSIIHDDLIITASSCLQLAWNNRFFRENPAFLSARVGSTFHNGGGENIPILEVFFHPGYNPKTLLNNICVLRLQRRLAFKKKSRRLKKISIDRRAHQLPYNTPGITIIGWGARQRGNFIKDPYLTFAVLDIYHLQECQDVYSKQYVTKTNFCAGFISHGGGACNRDVGGPGVVHGILAGVVSFGSPICGTPDAPTVFTKLGYYSDWIENIMDQDIPTSRKRTTTLQSTIFLVPTAEPPTTRFKLKPLTFTNPTTINDEEDVLRIKPTPLNENEDPLSMLRDPDLLREFINSIVGDKKINKNILAQFLQDTIDDTVTTKKQSKSQVVERIPFTYSPVTTLETTKVPSTLIGFFDDNKETVTVRIKEDKPVKKKDKQKGKTKHKNDKNKFKYKKKGESKENKKEKERENEKVKVQETKIGKEKIKKKTTTKVKVKERTEKKENKLVSNTNTTSDNNIEQDIMNILDNINLNELYMSEKKGYGKKDLEIKIRNETDNDLTLRTRNDSNQRKHDERNTVLNFDYYNDDEEYSDLQSSESGANSEYYENGMEIDAILNTSPYSINNLKSDIPISSKELLQLISEVLKEELHNNVLKESFNNKTTA